jgi:lipoprotein signal peptidase
MTDQLTKFAIIRTFAYGEQVEITPFFNLVHVLNPGAAFSFWRTLVAGNVTFSSRWVWLFLLGWGACCASNGHVSKRWATA